MSKGNVFRRIMIALGFGAPEQVPAIPPPQAEQSHVPDFAVDDERIPPSARERVAQIMNLIANLEARAAERGGIGEVAELERIKAAHLPRLLRSYIEIPAEHRAEVFRETGRSASFLLNERLDKMAARLREISKLLAQGDVNAFTQNISFIDNQYGSSFSPFD
jgi:hypothetical protein